MSKYLLHYYNCNLNFNLTKSLEMPINTGGIWSEVMMNQPHL